jgi:hypothetical protein
MDDARRRDQFIGGIAAKVQARRSARDGQIERPHMKACEDLPHIGIVEIERDSSELRELRQLGVTVQYGRPSRNPW